MLGENDGVAQPVVVTKFRHLINLQARSVRRHSLDANERFWLIWRRRPSASPQNRPHRGQLQQGLAIVEPTVLGTLRAQNLTDRLDELGIFLRRNGS